MIIFPSKKELKALSKKVDNIDNEYDGVYAARFKKKIIYYNANNKKIKKEVKLLNKTIEIESRSILTVKI